MTTHTRILLIDDDAVDRMTVGRALRASGLNYEMVEAPDGATGLARAREAVFDCVLLDYRLPDVDAFELLERLLSPEGGRQAVMMLTGEADPDVAFRLMRAGALDHLAKADLTPSVLARAIRFAKARSEFLRELDAARRDAEEKSAALDLLNRQKSLLFSIIAHDLRNPFQIVLGLSDMLSHAVASRDTASIEKRAQGIYQAASQAHKLMEGLFDWATLQMDSTNVPVAELDLEQVIEAALDACREAASSKGVRLVVQAHSVHARSNKAMLQTILRNLVSNAVKFTPAGGSVLIRAERRDTVEIAVSDSGIGMTPQLLGTLFRLDSRVTTAGTAGERGSGLGLLLCKDLAERLGTGIQVQSTPGLGTTFSMVLG